MRTITLKIDSKWNGFSSRPRHENTIDVNVYNLLDLVPPGTWMSSCSNKQGISIVPLISPLIKSRLEIIRQSINDLKLRKSLTWL